jgi:hypothetical protein
MPARSFTSRGKATARPSPSSLAAASSLSFVRATSATRAPFATSFLAVASPMPLEAPVTIATLSFQSMRIRIETLSGAAGRRFRERRGARAWSPPC